MHCYYKHILIGGQTKGQLCYYSGQIRHYILLVIALINIMLKNVTSHMLQSPVNKGYNKNMNTE